MSICDEALLGPGRGGWCIQSRKGAFCRLHDHLPRLTTKRKNVIAAQPSVIVPPALFLPSIAIPRKGLPLILSSTAHDQRGASFEQEGAMVPGHQPTPHPTEACGNRTQSTSLLSSKKPEKARTSRTVSYLLLWTSHWVRDMLQRTKTSD
jgi:hypothetical protein